MKELLKYIPSLTLFVIIVAVVSADIFFLKEPTMAVSVLSLISFLILKFIKKDSSTILSTASLFILVDFLVFKKFLCTFAVFPLWMIGWIYYLIEKGKRV